jgi:hypothetical protein
LLIARAVQGVSRLSVPSAAISVDAAWRAFNRIGVLFDFLADSIPTQGSFLAPLRTDTDSEAALMLATEAGQVIVETLKRWPNELLQRTPEVRFALAKESCAQASLAKSDNLADKVLLLMHAADQADGFFSTPAWFSQREKLASGEVHMASLIDVVGTET